VKIVDVGGMGAGLPLRLFRHETDLLVGLLPAWATESRVRQEYVLA